MILISFSSAYLGEVKQGECIQLKTVLNASAVNITSIQYPNKTSIYLNEPMTKNGYSFNYSFCNTGSPGEYIYDYCDAVGNCYVNNFESTVSGFRTIGAGEGISLFGSILVMVLVGIFFFVLSVRLNSPLAKISFLVFTCIILLIVVFFSMVIIQQTLGGFENIVSGYSSFFRVLGLLAIVAIIAFMIFALLVAIRYYKFKRGFID